MRPAGTSAMGTRDPPPGMSSLLLCNTQMPRLVCWNWRPWRIYTTLGWQCVALPKATSSIWEPRIDE
eukprot:7347730-Prorocentrum_lima.AAC.1